MTAHKAARQYGDQMQCARCGKSWDVNDPDPPECEAWQVIVGTSGTRVSDDDRAAQIAGYPDRIAQLRELFKDK